MTECVEGPSVDELQDALERAIKIADARGDRLRVITDICLGVVLGDFRCEPQMSVTELASTIVRETVPK